MLNEPLPGDAVRPPTPAELAAEGDLFMAAMQQGAK